MALAHWPSAAMFIKFWLYKMNPEVKQFLLKFPPRIPLKVLTAVAQLNKAVLWIPTKVNTCKTFINPVSRPIKLINRSKCLP